MPNPLTGDFEAALQVSGGTINRLMATLHQNGGANPKLPAIRTASPYASAKRIPSQAFGPGSTPRSAVRASN